MAPVGPSPTVTRQTNQPQLVAPNKSNVVKSSMNNNSFDSRMKDISVRNSLTNKPNDTPVNFRYTA